MSHDNEFANIFELTKLKRYPLSLHYDIIKRLENSSMVYFILDSTIIAKWQISLL